MLNEKMVALGTQRSVIRELFEYGKQCAAEVGAENVFDFSIGNPSVPAPDCVNSSPGQARPFKQQHKAAAAPTVM